MILTVTLNAALDLTYRVERLELGSAVRVQEVRSQAGGKGVNVARVLSREGLAVAATGLVGGERGARIRREVAALGIEDRMVTMAGESRQTITVVPTVGQVTELDEPGPAVTAGEWCRLEDGFAAMASDATVVVLAGSLPPGVPDDAYARLAGLAQRVGAAVILDASGAALDRGLVAGPDVVSPNRAELELAVGRSLSADGRLPQALPEVVAGLENLRRRGAAAAVASLGPEGIVALTPDGCWRVHHPRVSGNPVGAGDALVAALAQGMAEALPWPERLARGAALAVASVLAPRAGCYDPDEVVRMRALTEVRPLPDIGAKAC